MRLLLQAAMIFFGTLMAAALLALGEPRADRPAAAPHADAPPFTRVAAGAAAIMATPARR